jgi:hypothetical protein
MFPKASFIHAPMIVFQTNRSTTAERNSLMKSSYLPVFVPALEIMNQLPFRGFIVAGDCKLAGDPMVTSKHSIRWSMQDPCKTTRISQNPKIKIKLPSAFRRQWIISS